MSSNKCKDNLKAQKYLQLWGIRPDLWPGENGRYLPAIYILTNVNKVLKKDEIDQLQSRVILKLCHMEMLFPLFL